MIKFKEKSNDKFFIAIPNMGEIRIELAKFLLETIVNYKENVSICFRSKQPTDVNRNELVNEFIKSGFDWLLFIDSDMYPNSDLLKMSEYNLPIISGLTTIIPKGYPIPLLLSKSKVKGSEKYTLITPDEMKKRIKDNIIEVDVVGSGCLLIHKSVFKKLKKPYFEFIKNKEGSLYLGEDFNFSEQCKKKGFKLYVDPKHRVGHMKVVDIHGINELISEKVYEAINNKR